MLQNHPFEVAQPSDLLTLHGKSDEMPWSSHSLKVCNSCLVLDSENIASGQCSGGRVLSLVKIRRMLLAVDARTEYQSL